MGTFQIVKERERERERKDEGNSSGYKGHTNSLTRQGSD